MKGPHNSAITHRRLTQGVDRRHCGQSMTQDLYNMIDEHLAWQVDQTEQQRPTSSGTIIVDWDGYGVPKITYRKEREISMEQDEHFPACYGERASTRVPSRQDSVTSSPTTIYPATTRCTKATQHTETKGLSRKPHHMSYTKGLQATYHQPRSQCETPTAHGAYIAGYDPRTGFEYDYNGRIVHVHREATRRESRYSEYYAVDAAEYTPSAPIQVLDKDVWGDKAEEKKRERVVRFVHKLLGKLDKVGVMAKFKAERRQQGEERSWVQRGYVA